MGIYSDLLLLGCRMCVAWLSYVYSCNIIRSLQMCIDGMLLLVAEVYIAMRRWQSSRYQVEGLLFESFCLLQDRLNKRRLIQHVIGVPTTICSHVLKCATMYIIDRAIVTPKYPINEVKCIRLWGQGVS